MEGRPAPRGSSRPRRTIEECIRETAEQRERGISVICRPTWEALEDAKKEIEAQLSPMKDTYFDQNRLMDETDRRFHATDLERVGRIRPGRARRRGAPGTIGHGRSVELQ